MVLRARFRDRTRRRVDVLGGEIGALGAAAEDDVHVLVSARLDDRGDALFRDAHERVRIAARTHRVDGDGDAPVRAVLEADGEGDARGEFAVELRLGGPCADGAPRDKVVEILRGYGVEKLGTDGNAEVGEVTEELPGDAEPVVYLERTVYGGVVDKALPTDCRTRFLDFQKKKGNAEYQRRVWCSDRSDRQSITSLKDVRPSQQDYT